MEPFCRAHNHARIVQDVSTVKPCLCIVATNAKQYFDRIATIAGDGTSYQRVVLITKSNCHELMGRITGAEFIVPEKPIHGLSYFLWAASNVRSLTRNNYTEWCVLEIATPLTLVFARLLFGAKCNLVQMIVSPSRTTLRMKSWRLDTFAPKIGFWQDLSWFWYTYKQCLSMWLSVRLCNGLLCNAEHLENELYDADEKLLVRTIPNAIVGEKHDAIVMENSPSRSEGSDRFFLAVCNIQPYKGLGLLLEGFRRYRRSGGLAKLKIAGSLSLIDKIWWSQCIQDFGDVEEHVSWSGHLEKEELTMLYRNAISLIHTSYVEGSPRAVLEALSHHCPVIASHIPGVVELAKDFQCDIRLFTKDSPDSIAVLMNEMEKTDLCAAPDTKQLKGGFSKYRSDNIHGEFVRFFSDLLRAYPKS